MGGGGISCLHQHKWAQVLVGGGLGSGMSVLYANEVMNVRYSVRLHTRCWKQNNPQLEAEERVVTSIDIWLLLFYRLLQSQRQKEENAHFRSHLFPPADPIHTKAFILHVRQQDGGFECIFIKYFRLKRKKYKIYVLFLLTLRMKNKHFQTHIDPSDDTQCNFEEAFKVIKLSWN